LEVLSFFIRPLKAKWGVVPFPKSKESVSPLMFVTLNIPKNTKHPQEAWEFVNFAISKKGQEINSATGLGMPVLKSVTQSGSWLLPGEPKEHIQIFMDQFNNSKMLPFHPQWAKTVDEIAARELDSAFRNKVSMEEAAKKIDEQANVELAK
jgi:multiple sugar transport system substrate-binding protein